MAAKNLPPSQKKLEKAREQGDVAKSPEITAAIKLSVGVAYLFCARSDFEKLRHYIHKSFVLAQDFHTNNMLVCFVEGLGIAMGLVVPLLLLLVLTVLVVESCQVGFRFSLKPLALNFSRLGFSQGLKRIFGVGQGSADSTIPIVPLTEAAKAAAYLVALLTVMIACLLGTKQLFVSWHYSHAAEALQVGRVVLHRVVPALLTVCVILGFIDLLLAKRRRLNRLRMDAEEYRRELRESEGDPQIRAVRRQQHQELLMREIIQGVRKAKVLLTNQRSR